MQMQVLNLLARKHKKIILHSHQSLQVRLVSCLSDLKAVISIPSEMQKLILCYLHSSVCLRLNGGNNVLLLVYIQAIHFTLNLFIKSFQGKLIRVKGN